jgi:hypothetical protein
MGRFGVEHMDIRWRNILEAPDTHDGLVCPTHRHKHQWRVVDFDRARKTGLSQETIDDAQESWIATLLDGLPSGYLAEHWG